MGLPNYTTKVDYIPNLPKIQYINKRFEGVVLHNTDDPGDTASGEHSYESRTWGNAFVHEFIDPKTCLVQSDYHYGCWGAGPHANVRYYQIEMCTMKSKADFDIVVDRACFRAAQMLALYKLGVVDGVTLLGHFEVSKKWPQDTNHTDPIGYLKQFGWTWDMVVKRVTDYYNVLTKVPIPAPKPKPTPPPKKMPTNLPLLKRGSEGSYVRDLQTRLNKADKAGLVVDGDFGLRTYIAVRDFQTRHRLGVDGVVGNQTWTELYKLS